MYARPRAIPNVPSVTINDGISPIVTSRPFTSSTVAPVAMAATIAIGQDRPSGPTMVPPTTALSARIEPTDRSIAAMQMTNVIPSAMMPMTDVASRMLIRLRMVRKYGDKNDVTMQSAIRTARQTRTGRSCR